MFISKTLKFVLLLSLVSLFSSCRKVDIENKHVVNESEMGIEEAKVSFATILSKAVYNNKDLRLFLKENALNKFDNDFDVFYPYVKDVVITEGKSFRQVLLDYCDENQLRNIEKSIPTLTILVPDFSWAGRNCFSIKKWNPCDSTICVSIDNTDPSLNNPIWGNGELLGELPHLVFPSFPVLIVKDNERIIASASPTKASEIEYRFANEIYNGAKTKAWGEKTIEYELENPGDVFDKEDRKKEVGRYISRKDLLAISPELITAYDEFNTGCNDGVQRDFLYYGMTKENTNNGKLNVFMRDFLYRFALSPSCLKSCLDSEEDSPEIHSKKWTGRDKRWGYNKALKDLFKWGDGELEFEIAFYQSAKDKGIGHIDTWNIRVAPKDAFYVSKVDITFTWNIWGNNWTSYKVSPEAIESKWIYPSDHNNWCQLHSGWDLKSASDNIYVIAYEKDKTATITKSEEYKKTFKFSLSVKSDTENSGSVGTGGLSASKKIGLGVSGSYGDEVAEVQKFSIVYVEGDDKIGEDWVCYVDPYIEEYDGEKEYLLKEFNVGGLAFQLLPEDTRRPGYARRYIEKIRKK